MLWEPLALAALNQPPSQAAAPPFARVLGEMFGRRRAGRRRSRCRPSPFTRCTPNPRAHTSRVTGGSCLPARPRPSASRRGKLAGVSSATDRWHPRAVIAAIPWFAIGRSLRGRPVVGRPAHRPCANDGLVACRDRQPVVRSATVRRAVHRSAGARDAVGVRQTTGLWKRSRVPVVGVERGVASPATFERGAHRPRGPRAARGDSRYPFQPVAPGVGRSGAASDLFACTRATAAPRHANADPKASTLPATGLPRVCPPPSRARSEAAIGLPTQHRLSGHLVTASFVEFQA